MRKPKARSWTDPKTGREYLRVRSSDANGKVIARLFTDPEDADRYIATLTKERHRHGRAAAVNSDEIDALRVWREYVAAENTAGRDAPALRDVIRQAIERQKAGVTSPRMSDLRDRFLEAREREELSSRHLVGLKHRLKRFVSYFAPADLAGAVTTEEVESALSSMRAGGLSAQTVKGIRTAAHGLFQWGIDRGLVVANPVTKAKAPKVTQGEVGTITPSQLLGLLRTALLICPRSVPALATWALCGARRAEICRLSFQDLDRKRMELRISAKVAKSGVARFVPIPPALIAWLEAAEAEGVAPVGKLVPGGSEGRSEGQMIRWLKEVREEAGIIDWPANALRHSFASHACALHDDFAKVAAWLGHARDPRLLVARYRHAVPKDAGAKWFEVTPGLRGKRKGAPKALVVDGKPKREGRAAV
ncbi:tyrosine-type recombinase/integrase [Haloferula sp. BvORR071]|uniref:tyrosine-type recombinase/integrase n=1 Tax=Haloferula sp. BvORR071 TaxID=1396141 RepID=UPI002240F115|nr:tyrosine-type recombinase/integrase [Haloferula sp. BvORR071]